MSSVISSALSPAVIPIGHSSENLSALTMHDLLAVAEASASEASEDADAADKDKMIKMALAFKAVIEENAQLKQRNLALESQKKESESTFTAAKKASDEQVKQLNLLVSSLQTDLYNTRAELAATRVNLSQKETALSSALRQLEPHIGPFAGWEH
jgi:hypothetical protein